MTEGVTGRLMSEIKARAGHRNDPWDLRSAGSEGSCWGFERWNPSDWIEEPPKSVKPRVPRSSRVSRDLAGAQVTPESGRSGRMGGRLNNWIDS